MRLDCLSEYRHNLLNLPQHTSHTEPTHKHTRTGCVEDGGNGFVVSTSEDGLSEEEGGVVVEGRNAKRMALFKGLALC